MKGIWWFCSDHMLLLSWNQASVLHTTTKHTSKITKFVDWPATPSGGGDAVLTVEGGDAVLTLEGGEFVVISTCWYAKLHSPSVKVAMEMEWTSNFSKSSSGVQNVISSAPIMWLRPTRTEPGTEEYLLKIWEKTIWCFMHIECTGSFIVHTSTFHKHLEMFKHIWNGLDTILLSLLSNTQQVVISFETDTQCTATLSNGMGEKNYIYYENPNNDICFPSYWISSTKQVRVLNVRSPNTDILHVFTPLFTTLKDQDFCPGRMVYL